MFCALNGATRTPGRYSQRQMPAVTTLLPASDVVPATSSPLISPEPVRCEEPDRVRGRPGQRDVGQDLAHHRNELEAVAGETGGHRNRLVNRMAAQHEVLVRGDR